MFAICELYRVFCLGAFDYEVVITTSPNVARSKTKFAKFFFTGCLTPPDLIKLIVHGLVNASHHRRVLTLAVSDCCPTQICLQNDAAAASTWMPATTGRRQSR